MHAYYKKIIWTTMSKLQERQVVRNLWRTIIIRCLGLQFGHSSILSGGIPQCTAIFIEQLKVIYRRQLLVYFLTTNWFSNYSILSVQGKVMWWVVWRAWRGDVAGCSAAARMDSSVNGGGTTDWSAAAWKESSAVNGGSTSWSVTFQRENFLYWCAYA